jgi:hypothetical protein
LVLGTSYSTESHRCNNFGSISTAPIFSRRMP